LAPSIGSIQQRLTIGCRHGAASSPSDPSLPLVRIGCGRHD
jgi:hypothetical protein